MEPIPYIDIHTHHSITDKPYRIATFLAGSGMPLPEGTYAAGIHPWQVERITNAQQYRNALLSAFTPQCVAIGEIGLDYAVTDKPEIREAQMEWFRWQLDVAVQKRLPVIIHCVKAYNDLIPELAACPVPAIIHGFTGSGQLAAQLLKTGCYLSFGERSLHSSKTRAALQATPPDRMFLETDESTLPIAEIYAEAAEITALPPDTLKQAICQNYRTIFNTDNTL